MMDRRKFIIGSGAVIAAIGTLVSVASAVCARRAVQPMAFGDFEPKDFCLVVNRYGEQRALVFSWDGEVSGDLPVEEAAEHFVTGTQIPINLSNYSTYDTILRIEYLGDPLPGAPAWMEISMDGEFIANGRAVGGRAGEFARAVRELVIRKT